MLTKILLLEDDLLFGETLVDLLEENNFEVTHVPNGQSAIDATFDEKFNIYILDINVPLIDGITVLKELRDANDSTPTIFLTSHKDKEMLARGFVSGADDYITKPFDSDELILRLQALLRRCKTSNNTCVKGLCHDEVHKRILYNKEELNLSRKEYSLLLLLMQHADNTVPKELISDELWNISQTGSDGAIRVYINRIKQLLPQMTIENIRGIGYKLVS
ncbi:response regulator transcription factor [Sulfurimonas sp.]|uniref:response regulator transcription factor n=1 Tax=Sulfurimonas sp. TaxID=2022749 RepID=UPI0025F8D508|nr:response regulator transcription factor [Sulfurimonas sp.]